MPHRHGKAPGWASLAVSRWRDSFLGQEAGNSFLGQPVQVQGKNPPYQGSVLLVDDVVPPLAHMLDVAIAEGNPPGGRVAFLGASAQAAPATFQNLRPLVLGNNPPHIG